MYINKAVYKWEAGRIMKISLTQHISNEWITNCVTKNSKLPINNKEYFLGTDADTRLKQPDFFSEI